MRIGITTVDRLGNADAKPIHREDGRSPSPSNHAHLIRSRLQNSDEDNKLFWPHERTSDESRQRPPSRAASCRGLDSCCRAAHISIRLVVQIFLLQGEKLPGARLPHALLRLHVMLKYMLFGLWTTSTISILVEVLFHILCVVRGVPASAYKSIGRLLSINPPAPPRPRTRRRIRPQARHHTRLRSWFCSFSVPVTLSISIFFFLFRFRHFPGTAPVLDSDRYEGQVHLLDSYLTFTIWNRSRESNAPLGPPRRHPRRRRVAAYSDGARHAPPINTSFDTKLLLGGAGAGAPRKHRAHRGCGSSPGRF
ncbi:hypothetical protein EVAR_31787_1 [Eumeta japonica]|uniref:Uncharacterized protein n=1 Tax=Eumeta variegata TaxID=151549 RepID=A0A4C1W4A5_EUMVA|nr:hypothetical protein EVAR_31787_1 [Eumeta japonica]